MNARRCTLVALTLLLCAALALPAAGLPACGSTHPSAAGPACDTSVVDSLTAPPAAGTLGDRYAQTVGPSPDPVIFVDTTQITYGQVAVGTTATTALTVRNDGDGTLSVKDLSLAGDGFSLLTNWSEPTDGGQLATPPNFTLEPGESERVGVVFEPSAAESYSATLSIDSDDPDSPTTAVALDGRGVRAAAPAVSLDSRSLTFDDATVGRQSTRSLTVSNTGDGELSIGDATIRPAGGDFELLSAPEETVPPGGSTTLMVGFEPSTPNATAGTLSLSTNDPDAGTVFVALSGVRAALNVSVERTGNATDLTATVTNATAGEAVEISVPADPDDPDPTDIDSIAVTPDRNGSFDFAVTSTDEPPPSATTFSVGDSTEPSELGYLNVTHSLPNENISQATIQYRVNRTRMAELESEPADFALYRLVDGTWERVNTTLVSETDTSYVFRSTASGLSEWTAATEVPRISVSDATANVTAITTEETVEIRVLLNNTGGSDGRFEVELLLNGSVVERRGVAVSPETTSLVTFQRGFERTGTYGVEVNDFFVAAVEVSDGSAEVVEGGQAGTASNGSDASGGLGFLLPGIAVVLVALVALGSAAAYRLGVFGSGDAAEASADGAVDGDADAVPLAEAADDDGVSTPATAPPDRPADDEMSAGDATVPDVSDGVEPTDDGDPADDAATDVSDAELIDEAEPVDAPDADLIDDAVDAADDDTER